MTRRVVLATALAAALVLPGCVSVGSGPDTENASGGGGKTKVCMMPKLVGIPYFNATEKGAEQAADELGVDLVYNGPTEGRVADQVEIVEQWGQQGCDDIAIAANDPDALAPAMKRMQDAGIATTTWDADVAPEARAHFVNQTTFADIGRSLVDVMAQETGGEGESLIVTGSLTAPNQNEWIAEMRKRIEQRHPKMTIARIEAGEEDLQKGIDITRDYLRANPDTRGVFGITTVALPGAAEAVKQLGLEGKVAVTGLSTPTVMKPYVEAGVVKKFVLWNAVDLGYLAVHVAKAQADGRMPRSGTFRAGRLGEVELGEGGEVLLGEALIFTKSNYLKFGF